MSILSEVGDHYWSIFRATLKNQIDTKIGSQTDQDIEITDSTKGIILNSSFRERDIGLL